MATKECLDMDKVSVDNLIYLIALQDSQCESKQYIPLRYKNNSKISNLIVQSPTLTNVKFIKNKKNYNELFIPLSGKKEKKIEKFIELIEDIEKKIIYDAQINSSIWFPEEKRNKFSLIKSISKNLPEQFKNYKESPKFNKKIIEKINGYLKLKIYNDNINKTTLQLDGKIISIDQIPDESWIKVILEFSSIYISKNNFKLLIKPLLISFTSISDN